MGKPSCHQKIFLLILGVHLHPVHPPPRVRHWLAFIALSALRWMETPLNAANCTPSGSLIRRPSVMSKVAPLTLTRKITQNVCLSVAYFQLNKYWKFRVKLLCCFEYKFELRRGPCMYRYFVFRTSTGITNKRKKMSHTVFSRPYWVVRSRLWYDVLYAVMK